MLRLPRFAIHAQQWLLRLTGSPLQGVDQPRPCSRLARQPYFSRYTEDALDLCDALACYDQKSKFSLNDLCRALGIPGKPDGIDGSKVDQYVEEGRIAEVSAYCETDIINTYRVWLIYELFRGGLTRVEFEASEENLLGYLRERVPVKPHLRYLLGEDAIAVCQPVPVGIDLSAVVAPGSLAARLEE